MKVRLWGPMMGAVLLGASSAAPGPSPRERLGMFVGTWHSVGTLTTDTSTKPSRVSGTYACNWSGSARVFLVCDGTVSIEGDPTPHHQLSVYMYDEPSATYQFVGLTTATATSPDLTFSGNTWTYSKKFTDKAGKTTYYRTLNVFETPKKYRYIIEESSNNQDWTQTGSGVSQQI